MLSDDASRLSDLEIWVPDASGVLALSTDLLYDDAPWLTKQASGPNANRTSNPDPHPQKTHVPYLLCKCMLHYIARPYYYND